MSEMRQDVTTGDWVVIAPERSKRPEDRVSKSLATNHSPALDPTCPFCAGNERLLPGIITEMPSDTPPGWQTRVVPNRFPAFHSDLGKGSRTQGIYNVRSSDGHHEVIIDTPRHNIDLAEMSNDELTALVTTYHERYVAHTSQAHVEYVVLFRNHGNSAGASLSHPHTQIIAVTEKPPRVRTMDRWSRDHFQNTGLCVSCEMVEFENNDTSRIVLDGREFLAIVPFAAVSPFELWVIPKRHQASFAEIAPNEQEELAVILGRLLRAYKIGLGDPPYNYVVGSNPNDVFAPPHRHWRLRIVPTLVRPGGFELGTGVSINPSAPEEDAATLREFLNSAKEAT